MCIDISLRLRRFPHMVPATVAEICLDRLLSVQLDKP